MHNDSSEGKCQNGFINSIRSLSRTGSFGLMMETSIFMGYFLGSYIDQKLETSPCFMLLLLDFFMIGTFIKLFQDVELPSDSNAYE